jgi:hypothetical protein
MKLPSFVAAVACGVAMLVAVPTAAAYADTTVDTLTVSPAPPHTVGDTVSLAANFSASNSKKASLQSYDSGTDSWSSIAGFSGKTLNSSGNYTFTGYTLTKTEKVRVAVDGGGEITQEVQLDPQPNNIGTPGTDGTLTLVQDAGSYIKGDVLTVNVDYPAAGKVTLWTDGGNGTWVPLGSAYTNQSLSSAGDKTFTVPATAQKLQARTSTALLTNIVDIAPTDPTAQTPEFSADNKTVTAQFDQPRSGRAAVLEVREIFTSETAETDATNRPCKQMDTGSGLPDCVGPWKTRASSTQNAAGLAKFTVSSPYLVQHVYRVRSGEAISPEVKPAALPLPAKSTGLPQVYFNTYEGDTVNTRTRYFEGQFTMTVPADNGEPECAAVPTITKSTMKGRGNYSWSFKKKGYTLKIDKATNLCGMGASKKWALIANHYDKSLMRNQVALNLGSKFTNLWTPKAKPVDFFMNGSYLGTYMLVERVSIQKAKPDADPNKAVPARIDIDELKSTNQAIDPTNPNNLEPNITGGYVMEWDFRKGADVNVSVNSHGWVGLKDPEFDYKRDVKTNDGISPQQKTYIEGYLEDADDALYGSKSSDPDVGWRKYIDEGSAVDYYLAMEFLKPVDGNMWASVYMYKPRNGKIKFGPLWDFDLGLGSANRAGNTVGTSGWYLRNVISTTAKQSSTTWFNQLNKDASFRKAVSDRWNELYPTLSSSQFIDDQKALMARSAAENFKKWSYSERISSVQVFKGSWSKDVDYVKSWMSSRRSWMNSQY